MRYYTFIFVVFYCLVLSISQSLASPVNEKDSDNTPIIEAGGLLAMGQALYSTHCSACHRPLAKTTKAQRSASRLRSSIHQFPAMAGLDALSDEQLTAIAAALKTAPLTNR